MYIRMRNQTTLPYKIILKKRCTFFIKALLSDAQ